MCETVLLIVCAVFFVRKWKTTDDTYIQIAFLDCIEYYMADWKLKWENEPEYEVMFMTTTRRFLQ